jgi:nucleoside-triphosphatase THEP1
MMKIKHHEIIPNYNNPFSECKLGRESYARVLTDIVNTYADGFVLAINNEWGTGKTTFVKMWRQQLKNEGFQTIYFNAWENDFDNNPLVALMSELESLSNYTNREDFKSVIEKGAILVKNIAPILAKSLIKKYVVNIDDITLNVVENATKASTEILEEEIKEYTSKKKTIIEFRTELEKYVKQGNNAQPLIFIIDELDRCRPNYSVEVLEQIKHFFSVSGIVFVLSFDKKQLGAAIKGFYGSETLNSNEYLRRFIDLEYSIPKPDENLYSNYLYEYFGFKQVFEATGRFNNQSFKADSTNFLRTSLLLFSFNNTTLRQQEKIFGQMRFVLNSFKYNENYYASIILVLIYLKNLKSDIYNSIINKSFSIQALIDEIGKLFPVTDAKFNLVYFLAEFIHLYNNSLPNRDNKPLYTRNENGITTNLKSPFSSENSGFRNEILSECLEMVKCDIFINLDNLINKVNLTKSIIIT